MSLTTYRTSLRVVVRGVWSGAFSPTFAVGAMRTAIDRGIADAWRAGGAECGIKPGEFTRTEEDARLAFVATQEGFMRSFIDWLAERTKANGGLLRDSFGGGGRLDMWANRWNEAKTQAAAMICSDVKKLWVLGPTEEHCPSCGKFAGRVYRNSVWLANQAMPQTQRLCCRGFNCLCFLQTTDARITPGRFPVGALC